MKRVLVVACIALFALGSTACSKNNKSSGNKSEFCSLNNELGSVQGVPSDEQLDSIAAAAPDEIAAEVQLYVDQLKANDGGASTTTQPSEEVTAAGQKIGKYITDNCPPPPTEASGGSTESTEAPPSS